MSRRAVVPLALMAILVALALAPWTISSPRLKDLIARELRDGYGLDLSMSGSTTLALLPMPRLKFNDVTLAAADGTVLVEHAQFRSEMRLLPLLLARLEPGSLSLAGGTATIVFRTDGSCAWDSVLTRMKARLADPSRAGLLRRVALARMTLAIEDRARATHTRFDAVEAILRWPGGQTPVVATGSALWRGETLNANLSGLLPARLMAGTSSPIALMLASPHGEATIDGEVALGDRPRLNGQVRARLVWLDEFLRWSGLAGSIPGAHQPIAIAGEIALGPNEIALPKTGISLAAHKLDGTVTIRLDGARPTVRATLASDNLDLTDVVAWRSPAWRTAPLDLTILQGSDVDLRISAARVLMDGIVLGDLAAGLLTGPDRVEVSLGRASLAGGTVRGRLSALGTRARYDVKLQSTFARVDLGQILGEGGRAKPVTGLAGGSAAFEAEGGAPEDLVRSLAGRFTVAVQDGDVAGGPALAKLRRLAPLGVAATRAGRTPFQTLGLTLTVANGTAELTDATLEGDVLRAAATGRIALGNGALDLQMRTLPPEGPSDEPGLVFAVTGPLTQPVIAPLREPIRR